MSRTVVGERELVGVAPDLLAGPPEGWLPPPVRRTGPQTWSFRVRGGPVRARVDCRIGDVWERGGWRSRSLAWHAVGDPNAVVDDERWLPRLRGELAWRALDGDTPGVTVRLLAAYRPPFGPVGRLVDRLLLHRVAGATLEGFLDDVAGRLREDGLRTRPAR